MTQPPKTVDKHFAVVVRRTYSGNLEIDYFGVDVAAVRTSC